MLCDVVRGKGRCMCVTRTVLVVATFLLLSNPPNECEVRDVLKQF